MDPFLAQIVMFGGNFAPRGWAFCDGQLLAISQNSALFSLLGTTYGGDGRTTFGLPELRGRVAIHSGNGSRGPGLSPRPLGQRGGLESVNLNVTQIPTHTHAAAGQTTIMVSNQPGTSPEPIGGGSLSAVGAPRGKASDALIYNDQAPNVSLYNDHSGHTAANTTVTIGNTGGSQAHTNMQPYLAVNYIIALQGVFPSRS